MAAALGTTGPPLQVELSGYSLDDLRSESQRIYGVLKELPVLWNVQSSFEGGAPEIHIILNRNLCDSLGVDIDTLTRLLESVLDGRKITKLTKGDEERDVLLYLKEQVPLNLKELIFTTSRGVRLTVGDVAEFRNVDGALEIYRRDQRRVARVTARIAQGVEYPQAMSAVEEALNRFEPGPGISINLSGEEEERKETFDQLAWAGAIALLLVFMVLAGTFESLIHPVTVLFSVPFAMVGVAAVLIPGGKPIGIMQFLGIIVLAGIAVNDAILLIQTARQFMSEGLERNLALAKAASVRFRPIIMTTSTTVLALLPLAVGAGEAAQLRAPLALTIIGGITASTISSMLVIPCLYLMFDHLRFNRGNRRK